MGPVDRDSRRLAVYVNVAKLLLLAALAPPVVAGIAQRASRFEAGGAEGIVALTLTIGSIGAITGALGLGALSDLGTPTARSRWLWILLGTGVGTAGLTLLVLSRSAPALALAWAIAQLGFSGAMAVLRAVLAAALPRHRRRGAVVVVLGGYAGMALPLVILALAPHLLWETTFGLAVLCLAVPIVFLQGVRPRTVTAPPASPASPAPPARPRNPQVPPAGRRLGRGALLAVQASTNIVLAAFLAYHPLDLAARAGLDGDVPVRAGILVLGAAVVGLVAVGAALLHRPHLIADGRRAIVAAGVVLALSLAVRAVVDPLPLLAAAAALSGAAVGLNNSALLAAALERAPLRRNGRYLGAYSAAGAAGQLVGPAFGLGILTLAGALPPLGPGPAADHRAMFLVLALAPLCWAVLLARRPVRTAHDERDRHLSEA